MSFLKKRRPPKESFSFFSLSSCGPCYQRRVSCDSREFASIDFAYSYRRTTDSNNKNVPVFAVRESSPRKTQKNSFQIFLRGWPTTRKERSSSRRNTLKMDTCVFFFITTIVSCFVRNILYISIRNYQHEISNNWRGFRALYGSNDSFWSINWDQLEDQSRVFFKSWSYFAH